MLQGIAHWWMWLSFFIVVIFMLVLDLWVLGGQKAHRVSTKEALTWALVWFGLAIVFNLLMWWYLSYTENSVLATEKSLEFFTGYLIEKSLSIDNVFIFVMIFSYFKIPAEYQHRILIFGVLGAIVMRLVLIFFGIWLISHFHWVLYLFGVFLLITGIKMFVFADKKPDLTENPILLWMGKHLRITDHFYNERFFIRKNKLLYVTPLFVVLVLVELSDLIFALDSIPAIFSVTEDPFIVFTSNIFAILGLRSLYFLLARMTERFQSLKYGVAFILIFAGLKMVIAPWIKLPIYFTLGVVIATLFVCILVDRKKGQEAIRH